MLKDIPKRITPFILLGIILIAGVILALAWGSVPISFFEIPRLLFNPGAEDFTMNLILMQLRLPRILLSIIIGASLGIAGCVFQGLLRNPMADPYLVGISAGAGLGALIAIFFRLDFMVLGLGALPLFAFFGGFATVFLVYYLAKVGNQVPVTSFLLAGVAVGFFFNALMSLLMVAMSRELHRVIYWLMGTFSGRGMLHVRMVLPYFLLGNILIISQARNLNLLCLGEEAAHHLGVNVERSKKILIFGASLLTASAVAVSGLIGFVGLVVPHIMRLFVGPDHRYLIPLTALGGAIFLVYGDTLARSLFPPTEIPVGIITALAGGPFFLYLLRRHQLKRRGVN